MGSSSVLPPGLLHVAIIMDGNGRWAVQQGLPRLEGHKRGARSVRQVVRAARELGLNTLTLYAFSEQNWERPMEEVQGLMQLLHDYVIDERREILDNGIRLRAMGNISRLPEFVLRPLLRLEQESAHNQGMTLVLALSYGGRESLTEAVARLCRDAQEGRICINEIDEIDETAFAARLGTAGLPKVDLLIRTSGEQRTSNFLPWETANALFYATPRLWPDFGRTDLLLALSVYAEHKSATRT